MIDLSYSEAEAITAGNTLPVPHSGAAQFAVGPARPFRILLVDDEIEIWWNDCLAALIASGYQVDTAEDGSVGWTALGTHDYDLLITDNKMPKLFGVDLILNVRARGRAFPIILASTLSPLIPGGQKKSFADVYFLEKPVSLSELFRTLDRIKLMKRDEYEC